MCSDFNKLRKELLTLNELSEYELLVRLIPEEERHSPYANSKRAKDILNQCVSRARNEIIEVYNKYKHTTNSVIDLALFLIPTLESTPTIPKYLIPVLAILIVRHRIEYLSEESKQSTHSQSEYQNSKG